MRPPPERVVFAPYGTDATTGQAFRPHPTQQIIRQWVAAVRTGPPRTDGIPTCYLQHGVNAGGTRAMLTPAIEYLLEEPGLNVLIGRKDFNDLRLSAMETFLTMLPPRLLVSQNVQEHRYVVQGPRGTSQVFFRELKDASGLGSQEFAVIVVVEAHELSLKMFRTLKQRCRQGQRPSFLLLEGNPPAEGHWLLQLTNPHHPDYDPAITMLKLPSTENYAAMTPAYRAMLEAMPPAWRARYVLAEAAAIPDGTPVYPAFVETVHVRETALVPDRPIIRGWDFGLRRAACVWGQRDDRGHVLWHREWLALETPETQFIEGVKVRTRQWFGDLVCEDYGDPAATQRDPEGVATMTRLHDAGITLRWRVSTYGERVPLINHLLSQLLNGEPQLRINPQCRILIEGLSGGYHYPELKDGQEFSPRKDVPYRDGWYEHVLNAWEYPLVNLYLASKGAPSSVSRLLRARRLRAREAVSF